MVRDHGFHPVRIKRIVQETADTRTYVLDAPFAYRAGQFLTVRACGALRSYSMSSSPETDDELMTTVKRVPGGLVSNWMHEHLAPGDVIETTAPAGVFCLRETDEPLVAYCGGSGITPVLSLVKTALARTDRRVRVLSANRDADSIIFGSALTELTERHPDRFEIRHHLDDQGGFLTDLQVREFAGCRCGRGLLSLRPRALHGPGGARPARARRRGRADLRRALHPGGRGDSRQPRERGHGHGGEEGTVSIVLAGKRRSVPRHSGETLLESARRAGLMPPFSCESGNCGTCIAQVTEGEAKMRVNNALDDDEVTEGWVLTCQGEPVTPDITVVYED